MNHVDLVQSMYIAYYGRPGDPSGVSWWSERLAMVNGNLDEILPSFGYSEEYLQRFGGLSTDELITLFYQQIFNRTPDSSGLAWYREEYESGRAALVDIAKRIWDGASGKDLDIIRNKLEVAKAFTTQVEQAGGAYGAGDILRAVALLQQVDGSQDSVETALDAVYQWYVGEPVDPMQPTAFEQFMLEIINWERANPVLAANHYGIDLNEGLAPGTLHTDPRQPLAMNLNLVEAARTHSEWMLEQGVFSHMGMGESAPWDRMDAAGYRDYWYAGENIAWIGTTGPYLESRISGDIAQLERNLFVDENYPGRGHRVNILNDNFKEVGIGAVLGQYQQYNAMMVTQDFGSRGGDSFLLGVIYGDDNGNRFYDVGEGVWKASIRAVNQFSGLEYQAESFHSGGYQLRLPDGHYNVYFSFIDDYYHVDIVISGANVKQDWITDVLVL